MIRLNGLRLGFGLVLLLGAMAGPAAYAAPVHIGVTGAVDYPLGSDPNIAGVNGALGFGGGLLLDFPMSPEMAFELGGIYLNRKASNVPGSSNEINIPGMFRFGLGHMVSLGLGAYYAVPLDTGGLSDYGLTGSLRFLFPAGTGTAFFIEGRYNYGLKTGTFQSIAAPSDPNGRNSEIIGQVGLFFGGGR